MSLATFSSVCTDSRICINLPTTLTWPNRRLKLVSMDFPASQRTIESGWSCLYYSEALRITNESRTVTVLVTHKDRSERLHTASLPLTINCIKSVSRVNGRVEFTTEFEHGLFVRGKSILPAVEAIHGRGSIPLCMVHSKAGVVDLTSTDDLLYVSDFTVSLPVSRLQVNPSIAGTNGYLVMPSIPTPSALCSLLTDAFSREVMFSFDVTNGRTSVNSAPGLIVNSVGGDALAQLLLGFDGVFTAWEVARLPLSVFTPEAFAIALNSSMNRYMINENASSLVYRDIHGSLHETQLICGRYTSHRALAAVVESAMRPNMPPDFRITCDGTFVQFKCDSPFDLLFGGHASAWCTMLGFTQSDFTGFTEYTAGSSVNEPFVRANTNQYAVDVEHNHLRVSCLAVQYNAKVESYRRFILRVRTMTPAGMPISHGTTPGDTVTICTNTKRIRRIVGVIVTDTHEHEPDVMLIGVPYHDWNEHKNITLFMGVVPFSVCALPRDICPMYFPNTIGCERIGFLPEITYAVHGTIRAPHPLSLGHPTRVLVFIEDANGDAHSTEPEHVADDRRIFTEVHVNQGIVMSAVAHLRTEGSILQFRFANIDHTPYAFNNGVVSFTIELD